MSLLKVDSVGFDKWLQNENPFKRSNNVLDLSYVSFITPVGIVSLVAVCNILANDGKKPIVYFGNNYDLYTYLDRAGFITAVSSIAAFDPKDLKGSFKNRFGSVDTLIEVTKLANLDEISDLMNRVLSTKVVSVLDRVFGYKLNDAKDIAITISEVCQNTFDHNTGQTTCCFIAMQVYGFSNNKFLEIGIADYGLGLAETLKRNPKKYKITSHLDAIHLATQHGTSEYNDATRGSGLNYLFEKAEKHKGTLQIRSGDSAVRYRMDIKKRMDFQGIYMPGVQISFMLGAKKA